MMAGSVNRIVTMLFGVFLIGAANAEIASADVYLKHVDRYGGFTPAGATCNARARLALSSNGFTKIGVLNGTGSYQSIYGQIGNSYKAKVVCVTIGGFASYNINIADPVKAPVESLVRIFDSIMLNFAADAKFGTQGTISND